MNLNEVLSRIDMIEQVHRYTRGKAILSTGQRICLTQEKVALWHCQDKLLADLDTEVEPSYVLPEHLDKKVRFIYKHTLDNGQKRIEKAY